MLQQNKNLRMLGKIKKEGREDKKRNLLKNRSNQFNNNTLILIKINNQKMKQKGLLNKKLMKLRANIQACSIRMAMLLKTSRIRWVTWQNTILRTKKYPRRKSRRWRL